MDVATQRDLPAVHDLNERKGLEQTISRAGGSSMSMLLLLYKKVIILKVVCLPEALHFAKVQMSACW